MQHDRVCHEIHVLDLFGLLDRVSTFHDLTAESDLIKKVIIGFHFGRLCADTSTKIGFR